jgi:23S rRNA G2069 N7-methylase RlmK/C1962 C5-methylase RlmI
MVKIFLKQGREIPFLQGHLWLFSGAVKDVRGEMDVGELCNIYAYDGSFIARDI